MSRAPIDYLYRKKNRARKRLARAYDERFRKLVPAPPDVVGVGVQKCGSSWWFELVRRHPGVWSPNYFKKDRHFFDELDGTAPDDLDVAAYHRLFARPAGTLAAEWTAEYLYDPWTPPLLARAAPNAKILVSLRDPVSRWVSGHAFERRRGVFGPGELEQEVFSRGLYADQLERLYESFEPARVLVLQYEQNVRDTAGQLRRTYEFLGLEPTWLPDEVDKRVNATTWDYPKIAEEERDELVERYRPQLARLERLLPDFDFSLWPSAR